MCLSSQWSSQPARGDDAPRGGHSALPRRAGALQRHPARSMALNNLAVRLSTRYKQLGTMEDLNEAIVLDRDTLALLQPGTQIVQRL